MAIIRVTCFDCGNVDLTTSDVTVIVCTADNSGSFRFCCPKCRKYTNKQIEPRTISLLVATGVQKISWDLSAASSEPMIGAPISHDDLLDFHRELYDDKLFICSLRSLTEE